MTNETGFADHLRTTPKRRRGYWYDAERIDREAKEREQAREAGWLADMDAIHPRFGFCYFIGNLDAEIVKIGFSRKVNDRRNKLSGGSLWPLAILAVINGADEREGYYHRKFAASAIGGEWFEVTPEILAEIEWINSRAPHPEAHLYHRGFTQNQIGPETARQRCPALTTTKGNS